MKLFLRLAQIFMVPTLWTGGFDLVKGWFVDANVQIRSLDVWWRIFHEPSLVPARNAFRTFLSEPQVNAIFSAPACLDLFILSMVFYLIYRIIFLLNGGKSTGAMTYKSRH